jgi:TPR repeat protein
MFEVLFAIASNAFGLTAIVAFFFFILTKGSLDLLTQNKRDSLALWLMGTQTEEGWAKTFISMFDALFGDKHLSVRCIFRSCVASGISVGGILGLMVLAGTITQGGRLDLGEAGFGRVFLIGVAVNLVADYLSLLETRFLLGRIARIRAWPLQALLLAVDFVVSAVIIISVIYGIRLTGLVPQDETDWVQIAMAFSIYSAPFYSTFLTSFWTWFFILSTWFLRVIRRLQLQNWLDFEHRPSLFVALFTALAVFLAGLVVSLAVTKQQSETGGVRTSWLDRTVCSVTKGPICDDMKRTTTNEEDLFMLAVNACLGGAGLDECQQKAFDLHDISPEQAVELWAANCSSDVAQACTNLGFLYDNGQGVPADHARAAELYGMACDGEHWPGCYNLGVLYDNGKGVPADPARAAELYGMACDGEEWGGCSNLGVLYANGRGVPADPARAAELYGMACVGENLLGCANLGFLYENGKGVPADPARAAELYGKACDGEEWRGCTNLGILHLKLGFPAADPAKGAHLVTRACESGEPIACFVAGVVYRGGLGVDADAARARGYFTRACQAGRADACAALKEMGE